MVNRKDKNSVISRHCDEMNQCFNFEKPKALDIDNNNFRGQCSEILLIFFILTNVNKKFDVHFLTHTYKISLKVTEMNGLD